MDDNIKVLLILALVAVAVGIIAALAQSRSVQRYGLWGMMKRQLGSKRDRTTYIG